MYKKFIKRLLDIVISFLGLVILSPVMLITAILVRIKLGKPILFKQVRPGKNEKLFTIKKFRTMTNEYDASGKIMSDEKRLTKFGRILRSTSLDELPELWNIFIGEMSIIGPRPLLVEYLTQYTPRQKHRHDVSPGLTGWAQVNGRNALTREKKIEYDLEYIDKMSFLFDCKIFLKTISKVFKRENIEPAPGTEDA
ncbi:Undecaprenyl phosphate N,N'-diacetylbacillosamine 1-phosphate transferase [bioreactor metagenome]|uniref:Undecaprenyl phosphate N,N'-diacetylbacillosamine 1-phosphate transferase n=1 Tax=bioreactor metagenome TaxID=1076179 RepID=A0A645B141_9ZZZZ|nr:sugar transferase [Oscillospiraceae bacterium]